MLGSYDLLFLLQNTSVKGWSIPSFSYIINKEANWATEKSQAKLSTII